MRKKTNKSNFFSLRRMKWVFAVGAVVVIGGVMVFGLVGFFAFQFDNVTSLYMLTMIVPMSLVIGFSIHFILKHMEKYLIPLFNAFNEVSNGNLEVHLDSQNAQEYEKLYTGFNQMVQEVRLSKQEMDYFVNNLTHEFKTPITSIAGFADYLYETGEDIETKERMQYLEVISQQAKRLSHLTQNILLLTKVEACQIITNKETFSLSEQIKSCLILLIKQIEEKDITLNIPQEFDFKYFGNQELLEQVWLNLLSNAIKFTPRNGEITIIGKKENQNIMITISDNGIGMNKETLLHIFDKYYQNDTQNFKNGNGIGLAITKRIIDLCQGTIKVESQEGVGSSFTVLLPMQVQ